MEPNIIQISLNQTTCMIDVCSRDASIPWARTPCNPLYLTWIKYRMLTKFGLLKWHEWLSHDGELPYYKLRYKFCAANVSRCGIFLYWTEVQVHLCPSDYCNATLSIFSISNANRTLTKSNNIRCWNDVEEWLSAHYTHLKTRVMAFLDNNPDGECCAHNNTDVALINKLHQGPWVRMFTFQWLINWQKSLCVIDDGATHGAFALLDYQMRRFLNCYPFVQCNCVCCL